MATWNMKEIDAVTKEYFLPKLVDQIYSKDPILNKLKEKKRTVDGARTFEVSIKVDNLNHGKFAPDATFDVSKKQITSRVSLPVRGHFSTLTIDAFDMAQNNGKAQILNLLSTKMEDLEEAMRIELLEALYEGPATETDPMANTGGFQGLNMIVSDKNKYATLDRSVAQYDFWRAEVIEDTTGTAPISLTYDILRKFYMNVSDGGKDAKNLVFVGDFQTVGKIETILANRNQIQSRDAGLANVGFEDFTLFNKPVYASSELENLVQLPTTSGGTGGKGIFYAINFDYLTFYALSGMDMKLTNLKEDRNSELKSRQLLLAGNFVATKPRRLGKIKDINLA